MKFLASVTFRCLKWIGQLLVYLAFEISALKLMDILNVLNVECVFGYNKEVQLSKRGQTDGTIWFQEVNLTLLN